MANVEFKVAATTAGLEALAACARIGHDDTDPPDHIADEAWAEAEQLIDKIEEAAALR